MNPHGVQVKVAADANLDYETKRTYELTLAVTDKIDHESNPDPSLDDTLAVRIALEDVTTASAVIEVDNPSPVVGETVTFTAVVKEFGEGRDVYYRFTGDGGIHISASPILTIRRDSPGTETVTLRALYEMPDGTENPPTVGITAEPVTVTWRSQ